MIIIQIGDKLKIQGRAGYKPWISIPTETRRIQVQAWIDNGEITVYAIKRDNRSIEL